MPLIDLDFAESERDRWREPDLEDFFGGRRTSWDALSEREQREVADNFLVNKGEEFPPPDFGDLALPVVDPRGDLDPSNDAINKNAVDNADARLNQVEGIDERTRRGAQDRLNEIQERVFDE